MSDNSLNKRMKALEDLVRLAEPVATSAERLGRFGWDFSGIPLTLKRQDMEAVLHRFLSGAVSAAELEAWAEALEMREDLDYDEIDSDWISQALFELSTPEINGPNSNEKINRLLMLP